MLAFNFERKTFAYRRLALVKHTELFQASCFMQEYLEKIIKADQCAQYVGDLGIAINDAKQLNKNLGATYFCFQQTGEANNVSRSFGATGIDSPDGLKRRDLRSIISCKLRTSPKLTTQPGNPGIPKLLQELYSKALTENNDDSQIIKK